jgi:hypothetical protein
MITATVEEFHKPLDHYVAVSSRDDVEFREMIRQRRREKGIPWEAAKKQLDLE